MFSSMLRRCGIHIIPDVNPPAVAKSGQVMLAVQGYSQTDSYSCGVSAGWAAMEFVHPSAGLLGFRDACSPHEDWGVSTKKLMRALREQGASAGIRRLSKRAVRSEIKSGRPVLAAIEWGEDHHWVCICGFSEDRVFMTGRPIPGFSRFSYSWEKLLAAGRGCPAIAVWKRGSCTTDHSGRSKAGCCGS